MRSYHFKFYTVSALTLAHNRGRGNTVCDSVGKIPWHIQITTPLSTMPRYQICVRINKSGIVAILVRSVVCFQFENENFQCYLVNSRGERVTTFKYDKSHCFSRYDTAE